MTCIVIKRWAAVVVGASAWLAAACTDPGCIRSSECGEGAECKASACVSTRPADAGAADDASN
jgi:hypothetical protein